MISCFDEIIMNKFSRLVNIIEALPGLDMNLERETMFLKQWMDDYENCIDGLRASHGLGEFCSLSADKKFVIYGAGVIGKQLADFFVAWGLNLFALADKNHQRIEPVKGVAVNAPDWLKTLDGHQDYVVISAANSRQTSEYIKEDYKRLGINGPTLVDGFLLHRVLQGLICLERLSNVGDLDLFDCIACSRYNFDCRIFSEYAEKLCGRDVIKESKGSRLFDMCGYILGQVCTLNCRHCCEGIAFVEKEKRSFVPTERVIADIRKLAAASRLIVRLEFIGGEPFLHPGFAKILEEVMGIPNIASFQIFSNGTVLPDDELCRLMKNPRVMLSLSSYWMNLGDRHRLKVENTKNKLEQQGIRYVIGENKSWFDFSSFELNLKKKTNPEKIFSQCFIRLCHRLHDGILYPCPHAYSGAITGAAPMFEGDCVNIRETPEEELPAALDRFERLTSYKICDYCSLPFDAKEVSAGIQMAEE